MDDGEAIGVTDLTNLFFDEGHTIDLLSYNTTKHFTVIDDEVQEAMSRYRSFEIVPLDTEMNLSSLVKSVYSTDAILSRFHSKEMKDKVIEKLQSYDYDIVLLESSFLLGFVPEIREHSNAKIILRSHNVEGHIWQRLAENPDVSFLKRKYYQRYAQLLQKIETEIPSLAEGIITVSDVDTEFYKTVDPHCHVVTIPLSISPEERGLITQQSFAPPEIAFIGSLDWAPNIEGLTHFAHSIGPRLMNEMPTIKIHIAGKNASPELKNLLQDSGFVFHDYVDSAEEFILQYPVSFVPLYSGSGVRIKILQAFAYGRAVVSTSVGIEGIEAQPEHDYLLADTDELFVDQIKRAFDQPGLIAELSGNGQEFMRKNYSRPVLQTRLHDFLDSL